MHSKLPLPKGGVIKMLDERDGWANKGTGRQAAGDGIVDLPYLVVCSRRELFTTNTSSSQRPATGKISWHDGLHPGGLFNFGPVDVQFKRE